MCAYNKVNGIYSSEHHWLLTEVLREEWGSRALWCRTGVQYMIELRR